MALSLRKTASAAWSWIGPGGNWKLVLGAITALAILLYIVSLRLNLSQCRSDFSDFRATVATERADALQTASTGRSAANETRSAERHQIATDQTTKRKKLDDALTANRTWANQPVPRSVLDSLQ